MRNVLLILLVFVFTYSCSDNNLETTNEELESISLQFLEEIDMLSTKNSMLITPKSHAINQTIVFSPNGKEINLLQSLGFTVLGNSTLKVDESCGLGKLAAAKAVGKITDDGGCAQVRKDPDDSDSYCVKEITCQ